MLRNDTSETFTAFRLEYTGEQWKDYNRQGFIDQLVFGYKITASPPNILESGFIQAPSLHFFPPFNDGRGALDGNAPENRQQIVGELTQLSWKPGEALTLRWHDDNKPDLDDYLGIDDLSFRILRPIHLKWNVSQTNGLWDHDRKNTPWIKVGPSSEFPDDGSSVAYKPGDTVELSDNPAEPVTITVRAHSAEKLLISHTAGTYLLRNGLGSFPVVKTGGGTVILDGYSRPSSIKSTGGVIESQLGWNVEVGPVELSNTTLRISGLEQTLWSSVTLVERATIETITPLKIQNGVRGASATLIKSAGAVLRSEFHIGRLEIEAGTVELTGPSMLTELSIAPDGKLDLKDTGLVLKVGDLSLLRQSVLSGRGSIGGVASGKWDGDSGITSTVAAQAYAAENKEVLSVGYALNSELLTKYTTFLGQEVAESDLLLRLTRNGDANLDGKVDNNDITILAGFYRPGQTGKHWYQADFNYDGEVNNNDITILAGFYAPGAPPLSASPSPLSAVPEPALPLALLLPLLNRRRHNH